MQKKAKTERLIWIDIMITLMALELMAYFYYGVRALVLAGVCMAVSLAAELISLRLMKRKFTADDLTCISDGLLIALMMPAVIDYRIPAIACLFTVIVAKNIFGGRLNMIFSPVAAAYLFILTSWEKDLLMYPQTYAETGVFEKAGDLTHSASYTLNTTGVMSATDFEILLGNFIGPMGTGCILLLIVSALVLIFRRDISAGAFIGTVSGTAFMIYLCPLTGNAADSMKYVFATNMVLFAAIYIISDVRIAPKKNYYAFFYGLFIALASYVVMITSGKENVIVIMSVLFTPAALAFKNLEKKIEMSVQPEVVAAAEINAPKAEKAAAIPEEEALSESSDEIARKAIEEIEKIAQPETEAASDEVAVTETADTAQEESETADYGQSAKEPSDENTASEDDAESSSDDEKPEEDEEDE